MVLLVWSQKYLVLSAWIKMCVQVGYISDVLQNPNNLSNGRENPFSDFPFDRLPFLKIFYFGGFPTHAPVSCGKSESNSQDSYSACLNNSKGPASMIS
jgi:hypothetical protein